MKLLGFICALLCTTTVWAGEIIATVGDVPISQYDVNQRIALMNTQQPGFSQSASKASINKKVLNLLIDEQVKKQYAEKEGLTVTDNDVKKAIGRLENQNKLPSGSLEQKLKAQGISMDTLKAQIKADLLWVQVLQRNRQGINTVSDAAVKAKQNALKNEYAEESYMIAEILLPKNEDAMAVYDQLHKGTHFANLAKEKSIAKSAKNGGLIGWVKLSHYPADIQTILKQMNSNQLSRPIATKDGNLLLFVIDKRSAVKDGIIEVWELAQMATPKTKTVSLMPAIVGANSCDEFMKIAKKEGVKGSINRGMVDPNQLPADLRKELNSLKTSAVGPVRTEEGDLFFMKCGQKKQTVLPDEKEIRAALEMEQMEALSDKVLQRIKPYAVIEYK